MMRWGVDGNPFSRALLLAAIHDRPGTRPEWAFIASRLGVRVPTRFGN
jgi:hypothetical protein